jgi:hypothetical protein
MSGESESKDMKRHDFQGNQIGRSLIESLTNLKKEWVGHKRLVTHTDTNRVSLSQANKHLLSDTERNVS